MIRVFVALDLPSEIKSSLGLLQSNIRGARWVPIENLHLTIKFLGDVFENQLTKIKQELGEITFAPFAARLKDIGHFSGRGGPKVIWAGIDPKNDLLDLREEVDRAVFKAGIPLDKEIFKPHVTLARLKDSNRPEVVEYLQDKSGFFTKEIEFKEMKLLSSKLKEKGPIYTLEDVFPFRD